VDEGSDGSYDLGGLEREGEGGGRVLFQYDVTVSFFTSFLESVLVD